MIPKKDKNIWILGIRKKVDAIDNTGEKKDTVVKEVQIRGDPENFGESKSYSYQSCIKKDTGTNIDRLF